MKHNTVIAMGVFVAMILSGCGSQEPLAPDLTEVEGPQTLGLGLGNDPDPITVMTRNIYVGAAIESEDLAILLNQPPVVVVALLGQIVANGLAQLANNNSELLRFQRLAAEINDKQPHLVGLQEVAKILLPGQMVEVDYLDFLLGALNLLSELPYREVGRIDNVTLAFPDLFPGFQITDSDVVLARSDVMILGKSMTKHYEAKIDFNILGNQIQFFRGFVVVKAKVGKRVYRFFNTHLENADFAIRRLQAEELADSLRSNEGLPTILVGDFNSRANDPVPGGTYEFLTSDEGLVDVWKLLTNGLDGFTCCHAADLTIQGPSLTSRIDLILTRNRPVLEGLASVVGDVNFSGLWPSDHAGVVATLVIGVQKHRGAMVALDAFRHE